MTGNIHQLETMGLVDGPGVRTVVFLSGCQLRCCYCHNPDTWMRCGQQMEPEALLARLLRMKPYYDRSGGGVTFSGGEPLLQPEFLLTMLRLCRQNGIHTCLDTAGVGVGKISEILQFTDLVLYDVKHEEASAYRRITGQDMNTTLRFVEAVRASGVPMWVRHVVVPGLTDDAVHLAHLADYVRTLPRVQRVELLPYHLLGREKYTQFGMTYPLAGVPAMDAAACRDLQHRYFSEWEEIRYDAV